MDFKNSLLLRVLPASVSELPHFWRSWLVNYLLTVAMYLGCGTAWSLVVYAGVPAGTGNRPTNIDVAKQIYVSMKAIPFYSLLPVASEWLMLNG